MKYDHPMIASMVSEGMSWPEIAGRLNLDPKQVRQAHWKWAKARKDDTSVETRDGMEVVQKWLRTPEGTIHVKAPRGFDTEASTDAFFADALARFEAQLPHREPPPMRAPATTGLAVLSIYDAHFGMRADRAETGTASQDLNIISEEFKACADGLVGLSRIYDPSKFLIPLGHDFSHVNQYVGKAMTTRNGTEQDVDTRLWKIHRAVCDAAVYLIDAARATGRPVDVIMVPGNHDPDENFKLGEYLQAWYRHDDGVTITNTPTMHKFYSFYSNAFMLTHGEHYMKKNAAGNPILTFAAECPPEIWVRGHHGGRWILSGHLHARRKGHYTPTSDMMEEKGVVTYVLPGLTATDDWHYRSGYRHKRAATLQMFSAQGNLLGLHEVSP